MLILSLYVPAIGHLLAEEERKWVVSLNCCDEVLSAEYHNIRASQGMKVS
jgi:hypothetical protein